MIKMLMINDLKYMRKDPMTYGVIAMPIGMIIAYQLGMMNFEFLRAYSHLFRYVFLTMGSVFVGIILGLRMLDEKDEHLLQCYAVTPLGLKGYYRYRGTVCFILAALIVSGIGLGVGCEWRLLSVVTLYGALLGRVTMLGVSCMLRNKIQGMVMAKAIGMMVLLPCVRLLGENKWDGILVVLPWDYAYQMCVLEQFAWPIYLLYLGCIMALGYCFKSSSFKSL